MVKQLTCVCPIYNVRSYTRYSLNSNAEVACGDYFVWVRG